MFARLIRYVERWFRPKLVAAPVGGIANRMQGIDACWLLAQEFNLPFEVLWVHEWALDAPFERLFQPLPGRGRVREVPSFEAWKELTENNEKTHFLDHRFIAQFFPDATPKDWKQIIDGARRQSKSLTIFAWQRFKQKKQGMSVFKPNSEVSDLMKPFVEHCASAIGVHVRRTDHAISHNNSSTSEFFQRIDKLPKDSKIFLATDDPVEEEAFLERYGDRVLWYPKRSRDRDSIEGVQDGVVDLFLLSRTQRILGSYGSTFSRTAGFLGAKKVEFVKESEAK